MCKFRLSLAALAVWLAVPASTDAWAQSAAQITPPSFRPAAPRGGGSLVFSGQPGLEAPAGAENLSVTIARISVQGGLPGLDQEVAALRARLVGKRIPASEIFAAVRELEATYAKAGYVLVRVVLPAQTLKDGGDLRLVVINGFIQRIDYRNVPDQVKARISAVVEPLVGRPGLTLAEIERRLLIAGDTPGVSLRSALQAGDASGATVLVLEPRYRRLGAFVGFDNTLSGQLGRSNLTAGVDINSVLSQGELVYLRTAGHFGGTQNGLGGFVDEYPRARTLAGGFIVPIGVDGMTFNLEAVNSRTTPKPPAGIVAGVNYFSEYDRFSARLRYPWIKSRALTVASDVVFDAENETQGLLVGAAFPIAKDRLRVLRLSSDLAYNSDWAGYFTARSVLSFGIAGLGARTNEGGNRFIPLSRQGADPNFQKFEVAATYAKTLVEHAVFNFYARAQTSFNQALPQAEQIGIASFQELSTFNAGTLGGDSGWVVRGELSSPWQIENLGWPVTVAPYAFGATGALYLNRPTIVEQGTTHVSSIGIGLRLLSVIEPAYSQASLTLEYGRAFRDDDQPDSNRFTVVGTVRF
jgi:hemolysin activation/secretion protein